MFATALNAVFRLHTAFFNDTKKVHEKDKNHCASRFHSDYLNQDGRLLVADMLVSLPDAPIPPMAAMIKEHVCTALFSVKISALLLSFLSENRLDFSISPRNINIDLFRIVLIDTQTRTWG